MSPIESKRLRTLGFVLVDTVTYAAVVTIAATILALVVGIATGGGLVRAKELLFLGGFVLLAYSTVRLWPTSIDDVRDDPSGESIPADPEPTRLEEVSRSVPPARWLDEPSERRISTAGKLFWGALGLLFVSFIMEVVFGIGAPV